MKAKYTLLPCPFCKMQSETGEGWEDTMHLTGAVWKNMRDSDGEILFRHYGTFYEQDWYDSFEGECWEINCATTYGGCGAHISGDSELEVLEKWNRRD